MQEQIYHLAETASVQNMWASHKIPSLHGWIFNLRTGQINEVINLEPPVMDSAGEKTVLAKASR